MTEFIRKTFKYLFHGNRLPGYIISHAPLIIISYWRDFYQHRHDFAKILPPHRPSHLLFQLGWHVETEERLNEIKQQIAAIPTDFPPLHMTFLCNSTAEQEILRNAGFTAELCHQNAFLDEKRYQIIDRKHVKYNAVYLARITPFKRHYLAQDVDKLCLVGNYSVHEERYFNEIILELKNADWKRKVRSSQVSKLFSNARCGLCLSAVEGAMFVSTEYLLSGLPVVSTESLGGRDEFFEPEFARIVDSTPEAVANAVEEIINRPPDRSLIRDLTIERMNNHRNRFKKIIQDIYDTENTTRNFELEWPEVFVHKFALRTRVPLPVRWQKVPRKNRKIKIK